MNFKKIGGSQNHHLFLPYNRAGVLRDTYWVRYYNAAKGRLEESLKTNLLGDARINRDLKIAAFLGNRAKFKGKVFLVEEKYPEFLELKRIKAKATYESYNNQWKNHLKDYFGGMILEDVTETEWLTYVQVKRQELPDRKFFNDAKCLSGFLNWLHRGGYIAKLPKIPNVDPEIAEGKVYSPEQITALFKHADSELALQLHMALTMGMRIGEIMSLEWDQVDLVKKTIYLPEHKTKIRKERTFGLSPICYDLLSARKLISQGLAVFPSPTDPDKTQGRDGNKTAWTTCKRLAEVPKAHRFHWLRHTFLTHAFKKSVNPALICEYAGLSLEEATKTYLHFTVEDTRVVSTLVEFD